MANEFKAWYRHNDPQNARDDFKEFNRPYKERYERPPEYSPSEEEYNRFSERKDITEDQEKREKSTERQQSESKSRQQQANSRKVQNATKSIARSVAGNCVAIVVGATVVVGGYQAIEAKNAIPEPEPIVQVIESAEADWSDWLALTEPEDSIMVKLLDADGNLVKEVSAPVTIAETEPTCTKSGSKVYTAVVEDEGKEYSDSHTETLPALGHRFDDGTPGVDENGDDVIEYECTQCHEKFTISSSIDENDD